MGTQIVVRPDAIGDAVTGPQRKGAVAEIIGTLADAQHAYRVRFAEGAEISLRRNEFFHSQAGEDRSSGRR